MDLIQQWLLEQVYSVAIGITFFVALFVIVGIYTGLEELRKRNLNLFFRIILCIPAILLGWIAAGPLFVIIFRDWDFMGENAKHVFEGIWISVVVFQATPEKGRIVAIPFLLIFIAVQLSVPYIADIMERPDIYGTTDVVIAIVAIITAVGTYIYFYSNSDNGSSTPRKSEN